MTESARTRQGYDLVAARYEQELGDELSHKPIDRALLDAFAELTAGGLVADIGSGPGHVAAYLAHRGVRAVALDLSAEMCVLASRATSMTALTADMTALPVRDGVLSGIVSMYAVIHLGDRQRTVAYAGFMRVLRPGGHALIAFHTSDAEIAFGGSRTLTEWWGYDVEMTFRFLDPDIETRLLLQAGFELVARLDREPHLAVEHASRRSYVLVRRPVG